MPCRTPFAAICKEPTGSDVATILRLGSDLPDSRGNPFERWSPVSLYHLHTFGMRNNDVEPFHYRITCRKLGAVDDDLE